MSLKIIFIFFNTVGKKVAGTEVMKFYYLIVRMGMCEFTVLCWRYLLLPREPTFNKNAKRKAKGFFFHCSIEFFLIDVRIEP